MNKDVEVQGVLVVREGFDDAGEVENGGPLAFATGLPDDLAVEEGGGFLGERSWWKSKYLVSADSFVCRG